MTQSRSDRRNFFRRLVHLSFAGLLPRKIMASNIFDPASLHNNNIEASNDMTVTSANVCEDFEAGCHNINVVTPTHYSPHILFALNKAAANGLRLPVAYNTSGWERMEILQLLDGIIDIYLSDFKYYDPEIADKYSPGANTYPEITKKAIIEMNRQVGVADPEKSKGILNRGLIIRHLVMPNNAGGTADIMKWIAGNLPVNTYVNLMSQYTPVFKAHDYPVISRRLTVREYQKAVRAAYAAGLTNLDIQGV